MDKKLKRIKRKIDRVWKKGTLPERVSQSDMYVAMQVWYDLYTGGKSFVCIESVANFFKDNGFTVKLVEVNYYIEVGGAQS